MVNFFHLYAAKKPGWADCVSRSGKRTWASELGSRAKASESTQILTKIINPSINLLMVKENLISQVGQGSIGGMGGPAASRKDELERNTSREEHFKKIEFNVDEEEPVDLMEVLVGDLFI